jgi:hypothetical protein
VDIRSLAYPGHPSTEERPCACYEGLLFLGHLVEEVGAKRWRSSRPSRAAVCPDEIVVECSVEQAGAAKAQLEKAMMEGIDAALNRTGKVYIAVEVELRVASPWVEK